MYWPRVSRYTRKLTKTVLHSIPLLFLWIELYYLTLPFLCSDVYKACMDEEKIEATGLSPLLDMLRRLGGWPVLEGDAWDSAAFDWKETVYRFRRHGYSTDYLVDFSIVTDSKNSSWRVIDIDQVAGRHPTLLTSQKWT